MLTISRKTYLSVLRALTLRFLAVTFGAGSPEPNTPEGAFIASLKSRFENIFRGQLNSATTKSEIKSSN